MKKLLYCAAALATILFAGSCQKENLEPVVDGGVTYTITLDDGTQTKASHSYNEYDLYYQVHKTVNEDEISTSKILFKDKVKMEGNSTTVTLNLLNNQDYTILFWANKHGEGYFNVADLRNVGMYQAVSNNDDRDAFCGISQLSQHAGQQTKTVVLKRPFAQLNIATLVNKVGYDITPISSYVKVDKIPVAYNVYSGEQVGENKTVEFGVTTDGKKEYNIVPTGYITVNEKEYKHVAMNYILVPEGNIDVYYEIVTKNGTVNNTIPNVPVKKNYRTNIIGNLLTSDATYTVEIQPGFEEKEYYGPEFTREPEYNAENKTYTIVDRYELLWVADQVNSGKKSFKGETVQLAADIDLKNEPWTPIGTTWETAFQGTFEGVDITKSDNTYPTISNVNVVGKNNLGFFGVTRDGAVQNFNISNVKVEGNDYIGAVVGRTTSPVINVHVTNAELTAIPYLMADGKTYDGGAKVGGIAGLLDDSTAPHMIGNTVTNATIRGYRDLGGIVGSLTGQPCTIKNCKVENLTFIVTSHYTPYDDNKKSGSYGPILGNNRNYNNNVIDDNEGDDIRKHEELEEVAVGVAAKIDGYDENGDRIIKEYSVYAAEGLEWIAANVDDNDGFAGKTVKLTHDIDCFKGYMPDGDPVSTAPIGQRDYITKKTGEHKAFKGVFDGDGHSIKNLYQNGCALGYWDGQYGAIGLFSRVEDATIKNLTIDGCEMLVEGGNVAAIAGNAAGDCTFENITIKNTSLGSYNNGVAGIVAWSETGNYTFKNIVLEETLTVASLWGFHGAYLGGVIAEAYDDCSYKLEDIVISCRLDAYNDVVSNYQWYAYRCDGMIVGNVETRQTIGDTVYPDPAGCNITCKNVTVNYGDWMNYHYCESPEFGTPSYADEGEWKFKRVEPGFQYGGIEHTKCNHGENESHYEYIPFNQLFGGGQNGSGHDPVYGLVDFPGVTVNYPASYRREVSTAAALTEALGKGVSVILDTDIDFGSNQLAITGENQVVDLGGHALTTANNWGGISLKNGASIKNGTITHAGNTAAIKAFNGSSVENVTINATCATADKTVTGIAVQQGATVESIKNVTINGVSQGIEVGYQATVGLIENAIVNESNNGTAKGIGLVINGGKVGKAKDCTFKGETYGVTMHLKGVFAAGLELENCKVEGTTASIYAWDEKGISNTSGSLVLTYDGATTLTGPFVWDFEEECKGVVTLNRPE